MEIKKYIKSLLSNHDTVVIPDFGGFITNYESAEVNPINNKFRPPYKKIGFNDKLKLNDGLLIDTISKSENISQEQTVALVKEFVYKIKGEINKKKKWVFEQLGTFFINAEKHLQFEPVTDANYLNDSFALPDLSFKPIYRERKIDKTPTQPIVSESEVSSFTSQEESGVPRTSSLPKEREDIATILGKSREKPEIAASAASGSGDVPTSSFDKATKVSLPTTKSEDVHGKFTEKKDILASQLETHQKALNVIKSDKQVKERSGSNIITWLTSIVVVLFITAVVLFYINRKNEYSIDLSGFNPISYTSSLFSREDEVIGSVQADVSDDQITEVSVEKKPSVAVNENARSEQKKDIELPKESITPSVSTTRPVSKAGSMITNKTGQFYIIIGGFSIKSNALKLRNKLLAEGMDAKIIVPDISNRLHKVSIADYDNLDKALRNLNGLRAKYGNAIWVMSY
ncbi:MAG: SPOR domain-containing protein [Cytophagales bacterium]|nr:SPOR domain-containing protein [Cytophagales bacterium]